MTAQPGALVQARYTLERPLGQGGFAESWLARDPEGGACVVKLFDLARAEDWDAMALFEREAGVLQRLDHPRIPRFVDFVADGPDGRVCLVQGYAPGRTLEQLVREDLRRFSEREVVEIGLMACEALAHLHERRPPLVHRDVKPSNLVLSDEGELNLIDFGGLRVALGEPVQTVVGTFGYIPYEQYQGQAVPASDVYALGMTLVFLLTHRHPSELGIVEGRVDVRAALQCSEGLRALLEAMTAAEAEDRPASAVDVATALSALQEGRAPAPARRSPGRRGPLIAATLGAVALTSAALLVPRALEAPGKRLPAAGEEVPVVVDTHSARHYGSPEEAAEALLPSGPWAESGQVAFTRVGDERLLFFLGRQVWPAPGATLRYRASGRGTYDLSAAVDREVSALTGHAALIEIDSQWQLRVLNREQVRDFPGPPPAQGSPSALLRDAQEQIWVGSDAGELWRFARSEWSRIEGHGDGRIHDLALDAAGRIRVAQAGAFVALAPGAALDGAGRLHLSRGAAGELVPVGDINGRQLSRGALGELWIASPHALWRTGFRAGALGFTDRLRDLFADGPRRPELLAVAHDDAQRVWLLASDGRVAVHPRSALSMRLRRMAP